MYEQDDHAQTYMYIFMVWYDIMLCYGVPV